MIICSKCNKEKEDNEFYVSKKRKTGKQPYCKSCLLESSKKDYIKNNRKTLFGKRTNNRKKIIIEIVNFIKKSNKCIFCGEEEMEKCIVVCANCHRKIHFLNLKFDPYIRCNIDISKINSIMGM
jgi:hypothetical protein